MDMAIGIIFLLWITSLFINPIIAKRKNIDALKWFLIALFTGPISTLILLALPLVGKKCPKCAETVKEEANACRFCQYKFSDF